MPPFRPVKFSLATLLAMLALAGCGFHLRGVAEIPPSLSPMLVQGLPAHDALRVELENLLAESGVVFTPQREQARAILTLRDRKSDKRVLSVDRHGKVAEYELRESLRFQVTRPDGGELLPLQQAAITRGYVNTGGDQVLGKQAEELLLRADMRRDLLSQILYRLEAQLRINAPAEPVR